MSHPGGQGEEGTPVPDFAVSKVEPTKKKSAKSTVEDLERRLAMLGAQEDPPPALPEPIDLLQPAPEAAAPSAPEAAAKPAVKGGKNALLVRVRLAPLVARFGSCFLSFSLLRFLPYLTCIYKVSRARVRVPP